MPPPWPFYWPISTRISIKRFLARWHALSGNIFACWCLSHEKIGNWWSKTDESSSESLEALSFLAIHENTTSSGFLKATQRPGDGNMSGIIDVKLVKSSCRDRLIRITCFFLSSRFPNVTYLHLEGHFRRFLPWDTLKWWPSWKRCTIEAMEADMLRFRHISWCFNWTYWPNSGHLEYLMSWLSSYHELEN